MKKIVIAIAFLTTHCAMVAHVEKKEGEKKPEPAQDALICIKRKIEVSGNSQLPDDYTILMDGKPFAETAFLAADGTVCSRAVLGPHRLEFGAPSDPAGWGSIQFRNVESGHSYDVGITYDGYGRPRRPYLM